MTHNNDSAKLGGREDMQYPSAQIPGRVIRKMQLANGVMYSHHVPAIPIKPQIDYINCSGAKKTGTPGKLLVNYKTLRKIDEPIRHKVQNEEPKEKIG